MDGFKAYKYYMAVKLHFQSEKFDCFMNRGRVRGSRDKFLARNDHGLFERLAKKYDDREVIQYFAANFMYRNPDCIYHSETAEANYKEYIRRKQAITQVFKNDLDTILYSKFSCDLFLDIVNLYLRNRITVEAVSILNDMDNIVAQLRRSGHALLLQQDLLIIEKSKGFVKYNSYKVMGPYLDFLEGIKAENGQDLSPTAV